MGDEKMLDGQELYFGPAPTTPMPYTRPLDQAPAANPALDALDLLTGGPFHESEEAPYSEADRVAYELVRDALADRITPADLAEIQARHQAAMFAQADRRPNSSSRRLLTEASAADAPALVAELAELRARPTLTAEEAREALSWSERLSEESDDWEPRSAIEAATASTLRAIAEGAGK